MKISHLIFFLLSLYCSHLSADTGALLSAPDFSQLLEYPTDQNPEWPVELISVEKVEYKRNTKATFCVRPVEMIDTIVIHHSETPTTSTPEDINELHLARGTPEDPWYMIAYSYVINSPYSKKILPFAKASEGRPLGLVGAHAGSQAFVPMDEEQKKIWNDKKILCGKENEEPKFDLSLIKNGLIKANVTTIGLVVIGNYSPFSQDNPGGYSRRSPRYPSTGTQDMIARLSCQLQKKYPKIKNIKWHNYYHSTSCPGTIKSYIGQIKAMAKEYGCDFN